MFEPHTLVFHPGIGKTATSAIQATGLAPPRDDPRRPCFSPFGVLGGAHNAFASIHPLFDPQLFEQSLGQLIAFARGRAAPTVVSSEFLMRDSVEHIVSLLGRIEAAGLPVRVWFGIRQYGGFLVSAYMQALKVNWGMRPNETLEAYAERELPLVRYPGLIEPWARCAGADRVYLMDYDRNRGRFVQLFFESLGLPGDALPQVEQRHNPSLPLEAAEILRSFDAVCADPAARRRLVAELMTLDYRPGIAASLTSGIRSNADALYAQDYAELSARYRWLGDHQRNEVTG
jgi:hypothetical protein